MKNPVLPDLDRDTIERLLQRFPDLSNVELPKMEAVGKTADETIDRLMGRSRAPIWPWIIGAVGLAAVAGVIAAYLSWFRRPSLDLTESTGIEQPLDQPSSDDSFNGSEPYRSSAERTWPAESASELLVGSEGV